jgi:hypothetical protein
MALDGVLCHLCGLLQVTGIREDEPSLSAIQSSAPGFSWLRVATRAIPAGSLSKKAISYYSTSVSGVSSLRWEAC